MLSANIKVPFDKNIIELFNADNFNAKNCNVKLEKTDKELIFIFESKDITSLRASMNGVTTMLSIYFETKSLKNGIQ